MTRILCIALLAIVSACGGGDKAGNKSTDQTAAKPVEVKPAETKPADTRPADTKPADTTAAESKPADTKPTEPGARPASVTAEMADTFEAYVAAYEKLSAELGTVAPDCARGVTVVTKHAKALEALDARGAALTEQMKGKKDEAAAEWFTKTFMERFKSATVAMGPLVKSCEGNPAMKTAMNALMSRFPMVRKKQ